MGKKRSEEERIQAEISERVLQESQLQESKRQLLLDRQADLEALAEVSGLSQERIETIAAEVRLAYSKSPRAKPRRRKRGRRKARSRSSGGPRVLAFL